MPPNATVFECYGHGIVGEAVVMAASRSQAIQACWEWLGWEITIAFKAPEQYARWLNGGGTVETPVVFATDGEHFNVITHRLEVTADVTQGWEAIYDRE